MVLSNNMKRSGIVTLLLLICVSAGSQTQRFESEFIKRGFVDISTLDSTIKVRLMYSTTQNFAGKDLYGDMERAFFLPEIASMIARAQAKLKSTHPQYSLLILDGSRPMSVQQTMFDVVAGTPNYFYVANPKQGGGRHNYGSAVDITIIDRSGAELDMGSNFDFFGPASHCGNEAELVKRGVISSQAAKNRALLTSTMRSVGFVQHPKEWWHFHKYSMAELKAKYKVLDF